MAQLRSANKQTERAFKEQKHERDISELTRQAELAIASYRYYDASEYYRTICEAILPQPTQMNSLSDVDRLKLEATVFNGVVMLLQINQPAQAMALFSRYFGTTPPPKSKDLLNIYASLLLLTPSKISEKSAHNPILLLDNRGGEPRLMERSATFKLASDCLSASFALDSSQTAIKVLFWFITNNQKKVAQLIGDEKPFSIQNGELDLPHFLPFKTLGSSLRFVGFYVLAKTYQNLFSNKSETTDQRLYLENAITCMEAARLILPNNTAFITEHIALLEEVMRLYTTIRRQEWEPPANVTLIEVDKDATRKAQEKQAESKHPKRPQPVIKEVKKSLTQSECVKAIEKLRAKIDRLKAMIDISSEPGPLPQPRA
ncbi:MAG: hypothetical protein COV52_09565 [Gammaproteobacteria bacterium CG11_big_fil_rev_8_21_14_0_20_46_22]|nr:MAG: hypothetical protein COW05_04165 [Gammaproteobacteria bacterium CG12_big_fil_rev_8_21_14_0_65_46_12]PIR10261.1 MAG: hypothetical protein COV52_09565 [Gammaproteobacteria bacterium CG11_big_fil_rev_8_21_14_0_20_46_22]